MGNIIEDLKKEIGYVEEVRNCGECKHSESTPDWTYECQLVSISSYHFRVNPNNGCCKHFERELKEIDA